MILLIDWGNSYLKWMQVDALTPAEVCQSSIQVSETLTDLVEQLETNYQHTLIASVRKDEDNQQLQAALRANSGSIKFAQTASRACGVTCAYTNPEQLGIDRWLGVIAAAESESSNAVISIGSAITLDLVRDKVHLGGQIVPGLRLLQESLNQTGRVRAQYPLPEKAEQFLGNSTSECVHLGLQNLIAGYIENLINQCESKFQVADFIMTGGGSQFWINRFEVPGRRLEHRPALVFEGLAQLFSENGQLPS
jgi:type III pantothenate kinase